MASNTDFQILVFFDQLPEAEADFIQTEIGFAAQI
jgi:hypothetical protein